MEGPDLIRMARYPFTSWATSYLRMKAPSLEDLLTSRAFATPRDWAAERVLDAMRDGKIKDRGIVSEEVAISELFSYVLSRVLVSGANDKYAVKRMALAEGKLAYARMSEDREEAVMALAGDFGIEVAGASDRPLEPPPDEGPDGRAEAPGRGKALTVHFADYLRLSSALKDPLWKLVNQEMKGGRVALETRTVARLLEEAVVARCQEGLPVQLPKEILGTIEGPVAQIKEVLAKYRAESGLDVKGKATLKNTPPCMREIIAMIQRGENVSHKGRFALAAYLHTIGMPTEEILTIFAGTSDFVHSQAKYQIEHISGITSGTEYTPPDCSTMRTYGICFNPDRLCGFKWMTHPLKYHRAMLRRERKRTEAKGDGGEKGKDAKDGGTEGDGMDGPDAGEAADGAGAAEGDGGAGDA